MREEMSPEQHATLGVGRFERLLILRSFPAYADMPPDRLLPTAEYTRERFFPKGAYLTRYRTPAEVMHFIVRGRVETRRGERHIGTFGERDVVGGLTLLAQDPDGMDTIALEDTITLELHGDDAQEIFEDDYGMLRNIYRALSHGILETRRQLGETGGYSREIAPSPTCPARPLDLVERMAFLRRAMLFAQDRVEAIANLALESREVRLGDGAPLWREGAPTSEHFYHIVCGAVEGRSASGASFVFGPGDAVGALDAFAEVPRWYTASSRDGLVALRIERETFLDILEDDFDIAIEFSRALARNLLALREKAAEVAEGE